MIPPHGFLFLLLPHVECGRDTLDTPRPGAHGVCINPRGTKGSSYLSGCYKYTCLENKDIIKCIYTKENMFTKCRRTGNKYYWSKEMSDSKCCLYEGKVYRPGRLISRVEGREHCSITTLSCVKRKGRRRPHIKVSTKFRQWCTPGNFASYVAGNQHKTAFG